MSMQPEQGDYRPDANATSAIELAPQIGGAEHLFTEGVINGAFDFIHSGRTAELNTSEAVARWYAETAQQDLVRFAAAPAEALMNIVDCRGQRSTYLRPTGATVPAICSESSDSAKAKGGA